MTFTTKQTGHQTKRLNEFAETVGNGFNYDPYKTKQLTFKMEAVNAAPFPDAISL